MLSAGRRIQRSDSADVQGQNTITLLLGSGTGNLTVTAQCEAAPELVGRKSIVHPAAKTNLLKFFSFSKKSGLRLALWTIHLPALKRLQFTNTGVTTMPYTFSVLPNYFEAAGEDGPYTAVNYSVECRDLTGRTWVHFKQFAAAESAGALADRIEDTRPADWTPGDEHWVPGRLVYGSQAYQALGGEHLLARTDVEAEFGAGSYAADHPGFIG
jgi:hypothetical protein